MKNHMYLILLIVVIGLPYIQKILRALSSDSTPKSLPYHSKFILTNPEYKFYMAFKPLMDAQSYIICPKVGLKDMFEVNSGTTERNKYFVKISQKHIDFLICDEKLRPLFAIELDDKSHRRADVKERDQFKDAVFKSAGFPLYRIPTANLYSEEYIRGYVDFTIEEECDHE